MGIGDWFKRSTSELVIARPDEAKTFVVWKHKDGRVFWAHDSGCSCPSPFEDYNNLSDLTELTEGGLKALKEEARSMTHRNANERASFFRKVRTALGL